jgi:hypothetical protein
MERRMKVEKSLKVESDILWRFRPELVGSSERIAFAGKGKVIEARFLGR